MLMCINPVDNTKRTRLSLYLEAMEPPPVHYTPSTHYTQPPAVVQQHQLFSPKFITYIKTVENVAKKGFKNNKWYPITISSTERNIGYGHKINPGENFDKGLLDKQVEELLTQDLVSARIKAKASINAKYGQGVFERLDITRQEMLIDFIFNIGTLNSHPKFVKHLINNVPLFVRFIIASCLKFTLFRNSCLSATFIASGFNESVGNVNTKIS